MTTMSSLFMYSLTLKPPTSITSAILGSFDGGKGQMILTASNSELTLYRPDVTAGRLLQVLSHNVFGIIRSLDKFRLSGSPKDYCVIGSDSGRLTILEYMEDANTWKRVHLETFGKSGVRRTVPAQYLSVDPKGRCALISSTEKNKLVYIFNRDTDTTITISSPLEAHRPKTLVFAQCSLDVGWDNPTWATLEVDYTDCESDMGALSAEIDKELAYYELDLGLNHVVRKWAERVDRSANMLLQVPGGKDGPSGVLVCAQGVIYYRHDNQSTHQVPIPRRRGATENALRDRRIVCGSMHRIKGGGTGGCFWFLQTEDGDLFKVTLELEEDKKGEPTGIVSRLKIKYFDTIPRATTLLIMKSGHLFLACEGGNNHYYVFNRLDDEEEEIWSDHCEYVDDVTLKPVFFEPRVKANLEVVEPQNSLNPLTACRVYSFSKDETPKIYATVGNGARSSFRTLTHALDVEFHAQAPLPNSPSGVWTVKTRHDDPTDTYIVLTFTNDTLVLSIGAEIEQVDDSGFLAGVPTLAAQLCGESGILQVHPKGIRQVIRGVVNEWPAPQHRTIVAAATNNKQVCIGLSDGMLCYFEVQPDGTLAEFQDRHQVDGNILCLGIPDLPEGSIRARFLVVGSSDQVIRVLSLDPDNTFQSMSAQSLTSQPHSICVVPMSDPTSGGTNLTLHIGLNSGIYVKTVIDDITGDLSDTRIRFLGPKPVKVTPIKAAGETAILAMSSRAWLAYNDPVTNGYMLTPINYHALDSAHMFTNHDGEQGVVALSRRDLAIFSIRKLSNHLLEKSIPLMYTPRDFVKHFNPENPLMYVMESDYNVLPAATRKQLLDDHASRLPNGDAEMHSESDEPRTNGEHATNGETSGEQQAEKTVEFPPAEFGYPHAEGYWSSAIQIVDPYWSESVCYTVEMTDNERVTAFNICPFEGQEGEHFLMVGTGKDMQPAPPSHGGGFVSVYRLAAEGRELEFIHKTDVGEPPMAIEPFQGKMLIGTGNWLKIYDLGMKACLRKTQCKAVPNLVTGITVMGNRIICSDNRESVTYCMYLPGQNRLVSFCDDVVPRWTTAFTQTDYETVAGGDRFGNLWMVRCPRRVSDEAEAEGSQAYLMNARPYLHGTPHRLELLAHFFTQDIPMAIQKTVLVPGGRDLVFWAGLQGTLGILVPFTRRDDVDFFQQLENHLRSEDPPLCGRDHLAYRSYYVPVKGCIDGDLCERFASLSLDKKNRIAQEMERSVRDVERRVSEMRTKVAF